jgi:lipid-A-disaccharide synthase
MVVGEISGDNLATPLIQALRQHDSALTLTGILGPGLLQSGEKTLFPMERLNVMGLIEPLFRIPELYQIRRKLIQHFLEERPDVFIGVDAPDFNLGLERILRKDRIKTVHYVSPTVWAWRKNRLHTIEESVDLMLTLFPFESKFYKAHQIPVCFTGHPFADEIPMDSDGHASKQELGFSSSSTVIALLPGSRDKELQYLSEAFLKTAKWCYHQNKDTVFVVPLINEKHKTFFETMHQKYAPEVPLKIILNNARLAINACDSALVAAGTATLEVMLHQKPMVVAYRMHPISFQIVRRMVKIPYIALPNLLAEENLVPEYIQDKIDPISIGKALFDLLEPGTRQSYIVGRFREVHQLLKKDASQTAANAISDLIS